MISLVRAGLGWLPPEVRRTASLLSNELEAVDVAIRGHDEVVLHNDFHEGNFVLDRPVGRISGSGTSPVCRPGRCRSTSATSTGPPAI